MICLYQINNYTQRVVMVLGKKMFYKACIILCLFIQNNALCKTILVTGGAGFIGGSVTEALLERGDTVIVLDCFVSLGHSRALEYNQLKRDRLAVLKNQYQENLYIYECSIEDVQSCDEVFKTHAIDVVCHLAAHAGVRNAMESTKEFIQTNIQGTVNILDLAVKYGVSHCVLASSSSVYGDSADVPFTETQNTDYQSSLYGATKKSLELIAHVYHHLYGVSTTCLRFFTVYGPYGRFDMAPFIFMDAIYNQKALTVYGDGTAIRDFTYIDDIVDGIIKSIDKPLGYQVFNLGSTHTIVLKDFINVIAQTVGKQSIITYKDGIKADVRQTHASVEKALLLLGYEPKALLKDGLQKMFDWYSKVITKECNE
ncbi:NAD-dependent epimerase/dehydratase family protein [Candidatus Dependentiae bacterium]|nr:MAG: NAD-dependent epimerase/dehydratase family protein [Candidatus Dependentiae bacterium]